jgi:hypothetical protein
MHFSLIDDAVIFGISQVGTILQYYVHTFHFNTYGYMAVGIQSPLKSIEMY